MKNYSIHSSCKSIFILFLLLFSYQCDQLPSPTPKQKPDYLLNSSAYEKARENSREIKKIKASYLKQNELGLESCSYKGYEDPPQIIEFMKKNIDYKKMYAQMLEKKIMMFYESLSWDEPVNKKTSMERFF